MSHKERVMTAYDITRKVTSVDAEVIRKVEAVIYVMADKFLDAAEMKQLKEEIKMTRLGKMLYEDGSKDHLISQIKTKLSKGKTIEVIANEVEETVDTVVKLIKEM